MLPERECGDPSRVLENGFHPLTPNGQKQTASGCRDLITAGWAESNHRRRSRSIEVPTAIRSALGSGLDVLVGDAVARGICVGDVDLRVVERLSLDAGGAKLAGDGRVTTDRIERVHQ